MHVFLLFFSIRLCRCLSLSFSLSSLMLYPCSLEVAPLLQVSLKFQKDSRSGVGRCNLPSPNTTRLSCHELRVTLAGAARCARPAASGRACAAHSSAPACALRAFAVLNFQCFDALKKKSFFQESFFQKSFFQERYHVGRDGVERPTGGGLSRVRGAGRAELHVSACTVTSRPPDLPRPPSLGPRSRHPRRGSDHPC